VSKRWAVDSLGRALITSRRSRTSPSDSQTMSSKPDLPRRILYGKLVSVDSPEPMVLDDSRASRSSSLDHPTRLALESPNDPTSAEIRVQLEHQLTGYISVTVIQMSASLKSIDGFE